MLRGRLFAIQRLVDTAGGTWDTPEYHAAKDKGQLGADIRLTFKPNNFVDSPQIALLQSVNTTQGGESLPHPSNPSAKTGPHAGARIDTHQMAHSPLYAEDADALELAFGTENPRARKGVPEALSAKKLSEVKTAAHTGGFGSTGFFRSKPAWLKDQPRLGHREEWSSGMHFNTAAVSLSGPQEGVYYGTVEWGFEQKAETADAELLPLKVVNYGGMSEMLRAASHAWNEASNKNPLTQDPRLTVEIPPLGINDLRDVDKLQKDDVVARIAALKINSELLRSHLTEAERRNSRFELLYLDRLLCVLEKRGLG